MNRTVRTGLACAAALLLAGCAAAAWLAAPAPAPTATPASLASAARPAAITVMAAASLVEPCMEFKSLFEAIHSGARVEFNFANSQQLAQQLANTAPADVFASASTRHMDLAIASGRVSPTSVRTFARNRLVAIYPPSNPAGLAALPDLARPGVKVILAAPEAPIGQYSLDFLDKAAADPAFGASFKAGVLKNVVSYEATVKGVLLKVALGEADAGIVYVSDVASDVSGEAAAPVRQLAIPDALNVSAVYPIAPLQDSPHRELAQAFVDLVLSPAGQGALARHGFLPAR